MALASSIAINVFIASLLIVFFLWDLPEQALGRRLLRPFAKAIAYVGMDHDLAMFAPSPPRFDFLPEFELQYADGTRDAVYLDIFGRPGAPGPLTTRHIKLCGALLLPADNALKPSFCRYLVEHEGRVRRPHESTTDPCLQVTEVRFVAVLQPIAPFGTSVGVGRDRRPQTVRHTVYRHRFQAPRVRQQADAEA